jgi:hypothetical protein
LGAEENIWSCECVEKAIVDSQQGLILQLGIGWGWGGGANNSLKIQCVTKYYTGLWTWQALVNMVMNLQVP